MGIAVGTVYEYSYLLGHSDSRVLMICPHRHHCSQILDNSSLRTLDLLSLVEIAYCSPPPKINMSPKKGPQPCSLRTFHLPTIHFEGISLRFLRGVYISKISIAQVFSPQNSSWEAPSGRSASTTAAEDLAAFLPFRGYGGVDGDGLLLEEAGVWRFGSKPR